MRLFVLAALLLSGCATGPHDVKCIGWAGSGGERVILKEALTPEFNCTERLCYGLSDGQCYYGCPIERMPPVCQ